MSLRRVTCNGVPKYITNDRVMCIREYQPVTNGPRHCRVFYSVTENHAESFIVDGALDEVYEALFTRGASAAQTAADVATMENQEEVKGCEPGCRDPKAYERLVAQAEQSGNAAPNQMNVDAFNNGLAAAQRACQEISGNYDAGSPEYRTAWRCARAISALRK